MRPELRRLERVDRTRRALLERVAALDPELRTRRPRPDAWSVLEVVEHLILAEGDVLARVARAEEARAGGDPEPAPRRTLRNRAAFLVVMAVLRFRIPVRTPSRRMNPVGERSLEELRADWDRNHEALRAFAGALDRESARRAVFRHPIAGPMTPGQAFWMLEVHLHRHVGQVDRILGALEG